MKQKKLASVLAALALLLIVGITATTTFGQQIAPDPTPTTPEPLIVGIELSPPFVVKEDDRYTGMSIELWETLASRMGRTYEYSGIRYGRQLNQCGGRKRNRCRRVEYYGQ